MGLLSLTDVGMRFGRFTALDGITLEVPAGQFVCLVGASGSGKSTLLSLIAGLTRPTSGAVAINGEPVIGPGPDRGLVFQSGAIYLFRSVERNVGFGLELLPLSRAERKRRVDWYLAETGLTALRSKLPKELSGGQRQRVAIARALACEPAVLLLDEPFGALDALTRGKVQALVAELWRLHGCAILLVTHDVEEALLLADRVLVMDEGRIAHELTVDLPRPRDLTAPEFVTLRARLLNWLGVTRTLEGTPS
jgi:NitT/TauT family transport system ATP-binding protein